MVPMLKTVSLPAGGKLIVKSLFSTDCRGACRPLGSEAAPAADMAKAYTSVTRAKLAVVDDKLADTAAAVSKVEYLRGVVSRLSALQLKRSAPPEIWDVIC